MNNKFPIKLELEFNLTGRVPINCWANIISRITNRFQDLVKQGHKKYKVSLEAID